MTEWKTAQVARDPFRDNAHPAFRFVVTIKGVDNVGAFTECTLPTVEWDIYDIKEGGVNTFIHQMPGHRKRARLTLKNGIGTDALLKWCQDAMGETFKRHNITVTLMNVKHENLMMWHLQDAYPVKWTAPAFKTSDKAIAIQTIEFACHEMEVVEA